MVHRAEDDETTAVQAVRQGLLEQAALHGPLTAPADPTGYVADDQPVLLPARPVEQDGEKAATLDQRLEETQ